MGFLADKTLGYYSDRIIQHVLKYEFFYEMYRYNRNIVLSQSERDT